MLSVQKFLQLSSPNKTELYRLISLVNNNNCICFYTKASKMWDPLLEVSAHAIQTSHNHSTQIYQYQTTRFICTFLEYAMSCVSSN